jgi:hypothetical protein
MTTTKDIKDGWDAVVAGVGRLTAVAEVGALDEKNAQKLAWAEFGTKTADPRPTLTVTTDRLRPAIARAIQREVGDVLDGKGRGVTGKEILGEHGVGGALAEEVQHAIDGNTPPALAPSTLSARRRRGQGERALVATGDMMRSIKVRAEQGERLPDDE